MRHPDFCLRAESHVDACQLDFLMIYVDDPTNQRFKKTDPVFKTRQCITPIVRF
jgi:hypothetical protein